MMITLRLAGLALWASAIAFMISPASMAWSSLPLPAWAAMERRGARRGHRHAAALDAAQPRPNLTDTVVTRQAHTLVTRGPYQWVRHPFYDCMALFMLRTGLMMANWFVLRPGVAVFAILAARSRTEEEKLLERFGEPYRAYRAVDRAVHSRRRPRRLELI